MLTIKSENALKAYNDADKDGKKLLINLLGRKFLAEDVLDRIDSYLDACEETGQEPLKLEQFNFLPEEDREFHYAIHQMTTIYRAVNKDWKANYDDGSQPKWGPWMKKTSSGFVFSLSRFGNASTGTRLGSRLCTSDQKNSDAVGKKFIDIWNKILS